MMHDVIQAVAVNVRRLRAARGLSAGSLAAASGVGKATLSRIEAGQANPTVETLYALADALRVPFGALTSAAAPRVQLVRAADVPRLGGAVQVRAVDHLYGAPLVEVLDAVFPAGNVRHADPHPSGVTEHLVLVRGRLRAGPADGPVDLEPGDRLRFPGDVPHVYEALDGADAQAIALMTYLTA
jgi:XRE family transcriptional regulator, regulator of sulfur utilization